MRGDLSPSLGDGFQWIESFTNFERRQADSLRPFRLDRMRHMSTLLGDPHTAYASVHVAGSKGKGSVCAMTAAALHAAGLRTGLYGSPHLYSYRERFMLNGEFLPEEFLAESLHLVRERFSDFRFDDGSEPTTFELLTLTGMAAFKLAGCDWVVFETGLGGRLDATNILSPEVCTITSIELEHTRILGSTRAEIAAEKGGIIKERRPLVTGRLSPDAREVIESLATRREAPLFRSEDLRVREESVSRSSFSLAPYFPGEIEAELGMPGLHQAENSRTAALTAALALERAGGDIAGGESTGRFSSEAIVEGIRKARLPGRFEVRRRGATGEGEVILDTAHTATSVEAFARTYRSLYPRGGVLILGVAAEKDLAAIAAALPAGFNRVIVTRPGDFKSSDPGALHREVRGRYPHAELIEDPASAWERARSLAGEWEQIVVLGSFYLPAALGIDRERLSEDR